MQAKSNPYTAFAARLQSAFDQSNIAPGRGRVTRVATQFGVSRETSRLWLVGSAMPELPRLIEIAEFCDVSFDWLVTGRGRKVASDMTGVREAAPESSYGSLTADEWLVVAAMRDLQPQRRKGLVALLC